MDNNLTSKPINLFAKILNPLMNYFSSYKQSKMKNYQA